MSATALGKLNRLLSIRTRLIEDLEHHMEEAVKFDQDSNAILISYRTTALEKAYKDFVSTLDALEETPQYHAVENLADVQAKNRAIQDRYLNTKFHVAQLANNDVDRTLNSSFFEPARNLSGAPLNAAMANPMSIKLAKITVPTFDGKYEKWPEFKNMFTALMSKYQGDNIEKLTHLRNYLEGEPQDIVKHLNDFENAWELLAAQYENKHAIINAHLRNFHDIPIITSTVSIRHAVTTTNSCLAGIKNLDIMTETWDPIIVFTLQEKLSPELRQKWEEERKGSHEPTSLKAFLDFLEVRYKICSSLPPRKMFAKPTFDNKPRPPRAYNLTTPKPEEAGLRSYNGFVSSGGPRGPYEGFATNDDDDTRSTSSVQSHEPDEHDAAIYLSRPEEICRVCNEKHRTYLCPKLEKPEEALRLVKEKKLCTNCLYGHHASSQCTSRFSCRHCHKRHHTILHKAFVEMDVPKIAEQMLHNRTYTRTALLATAMVNIHSQGMVPGQHMFRVLIDQGSTANLISERAAQFLRLHRKQVAPVPLLGLDDTEIGTTKQKTTVCIGPTYEDGYVVMLSAYITPRIATVKCTTTDELVQWPHLRGLMLADPPCSTPGQTAVDMLIGSQTLAHILEEGLVKGNLDQPIAQKTKLGWIISGGGKFPQPPYVYKLALNEEIASDDEEPAPIHVNMTKNEALTSQLKAFWEIEEVNPTTKNWSLEEQQCYDFFVKNVTRAADGKMLMRIPFKIDPSSPNFLGDSMEAAKRRFAHLERRFERNPILKEEYSKCINEYITLGHAIKVPMSDYCHVIPHHAVIKETSTTTKLRTVFDASAKTTNGFSLNDRMHIGPKILEELWAVLLRWRLGKYALTSDIEKMYRQFWVDPADARFQQILWRNKPSDELELYELRTVTFGTAAAPFMAIQGILLIADAVAKEDPELAKTIRTAFYVDDCLKSVDTIDEAIKLKTTLLSLFESYGLNLRKWNSNVKELLTNEMVDVKTHPDGHCTALGMQWNTSSDDLSYRVALKKDPQTITKRTVLSEIASLFDPLGLLAPTIIRAKIFMQGLWLGTFDWDDPLPTELAQEWHKIKSMLAICSTIKTPRWVGFTRQHTHLSLHGFCDASLKAYAATIYLRTEHEDGRVEVHLLTSKTKIAPLKQTSIPRLELCAAELLAKLIKKVIDALNLPPCSIHAWTDSAITLAWISTPSHKLKSFVGTRVATIQHTIEAEHWRYIKSAENPADCATRCDHAEEIVSLTRWWTGPPFLNEKPENWPKTPPNMLKKIPELRNIKILLQQTDTIDTVEPFYEQFSFLNTLLKMTARLFRWLPQNAQSRSSSVITATEYLNAKNTWTRYVQGIFYANELDCIRRGKPLSTNSQLLSLTPFIDNDGILRVRGRLSKSLLPANTKHPAILPANNHFTTLIIRQAHFRALHGGVQLTLRLIREEFWIVRGKNTVKSILNKCVTCFRDRCRPAQQQMADLTAPQVQANRPFSHVGVDFAGYFEVKISTRKNAGFAKCYVSLFVCLTTKAIHLELAPDLSTQAFLGVLNRFVARRGIPSDIYSDRGTNFMGTNNELPKLWYIEHSKESQFIQNECAQKGITWHFNPARASHFGGLWEAGVKSMKTHLHRVLGNTKLTYEEFNTLITQIEACLNSRPLCPISDDVNDYEVLTPGHFLIGHALNTIPHPDVRQLPMNRLSRYQYLQQLTQTFWDGWSNEYLSRLQHRPKWKQQHPNLVVGQLVIIKEDNVPPAQWLLGRITKTHPGKDGLTRCADVKCKGSTVSRPIHKLCLLPTEDNKTLSEQLIREQLLSPPPPGGC